MISWTSSLQVGEKIKKKRDKAIASINNSEATFGVYCITFAAHPDNLFEIMDANQLLIPYYKKSDIHIVGLAKGKREALCLVEKMLMEVYKQTGNFNVRAYYT